MWIVVFNAPTDPQQLFTDNWESMIDERSPMYAALPAHARRLGIVAEVLQKAVTVIEMRASLEATGMTSEEAAARLPPIDDEHAAWLRQIHDFEAAPRVLQACTSL